MNTLLLASIAMTALCGMAMSSHAVPFLYGILPISFARRFHLAMSFWSFILMGIHVGMHMKAMTEKMQGKLKIVFKAVMTGISVVGLWLFMKSGIMNYITFRTHFAFLDYQTAKWLIIMQNLAMLIFFALIGFVLSEITRLKKSEVQNENSNTYGKS